MFQTLGSDLTAKRVQIPNTDHVVEMLLYDSAGFDLYTDALSYFVSVLRINCDRLLNIFVQFYILILNIIKELCI